MIKYNFIFNFSTSYSGGSFKRLTEYARWFNRNGGARFVISRRHQHLMEMFPNNEYHPVYQNKIGRFFRDCSYLKEIGEKAGTPDLYYSFGIPVYAKFGRVNWFHLSNVIPIYSRGIPLPFFRSLELKYLGYLIRKNFKNADIISAESQNSLKLIKGQDAKILVVLVNGSDDELNDQVTEADVKDNIACVVGTMPYKMLLDSYKVFQKLKKHESQLKLIIIGDKKYIPAELINIKDVSLVGQLQREKVVEYLKKAKYYISTTIIENSYNAASEGIFFADESYISDIGPHRELLKDNSFETVQFKGISREMIYVKRNSISKTNLRSWNDVIEDMIRMVK
jgi:glycosyltransferase involved in cell wall biosynthesis